MAKSSETNDLLLGALTINEFAARYAVSRGTIYKLVNSGTLRLAKINNKSVVTLSEARRFQRALDTAAAAS